MRKDKTLNQKTIYIISPFGLGDTYILCMLKKAVEECYGGKVVFIIKESHKAIIDLFEFDYEIKEFSNEQLHTIADKNGKPEPGQWFVAHPHFLNPILEKDFFEQKITFLQLYKKCLGLPDNAEINTAHNYPAITQELIEKVYPFIISNVILFAPEMTSCRASIDRPMDNWLKAYNTSICEKYENVIVNITDKTKLYRGMNLNLTLTELIALAIHCKKVFSVRSGLCDVIYTKVQDMDVIYGDADFYFNYSLSALFGSRLKNHNVSEKIISYGSILYMYGYRNCSIYGMGENGKRLLHSLNIERFPVYYGIDQQVSDIDFELQIFRPEDDLPEVDCIVVTVYGTFDEIYKMLKEKDKNMQIINLYDLKILDTEKCLKRCDEGKYGTFSDYNYTNI